MKDYLLDTNILGFYAELKKGCESLECVNLKNRLDKFTYPPVLFICPVTRGEIEYGLRVANNKNEFEQKLVRDAITLFPYYNIDKNVALNYSILRSRLFEYCAPKSKKSKKKRIEEWKDPTTSKELQIQENDLWIAAVALTYNLVFVTHDKMIPIKAIAGKEIEFEDWLN